MGMLLGIHMNTTMKQFCARMNLIRNKMLELNKLDRNVSLLAKSAVSKYTATSSPANWNQVWSIQGPAIRGERHTQWMSIKRLMGRLSQSRRIMRLRQGKCRNPTLVTPHPHEILSISTHIIIPCFPSSSRLCACYLQSWDWNLLSAPGFSGRARPSLNQHASSCIIPSFPQPSTLFPVILFWTWLE